MSENRVRRFKSFYSHHSFSTDKIDDLLSSIDFKVKRTKTLKGHKISEFSEHDEIEEDDEKNEYTIVKHITNKIPILKDNEFEQLKVEVKPIIDKYENYYNEYINKQDSKEETQIKNEIITTTKTEKKIINLGGKSGDELSISNSFNNNSININDSINNNNEHNIKNEDIKKKLFEENDNINIMNYDRKNKEDLWIFFAKKLIIQYNQRYKEFRKIVINALKKKYEKKINILLNLSNKKENANSNKGEIIKENILNLKINENISRDSDNEIKHRKKKRKKRIESEDEEENEEIENQEEYNVIKEKKIKESNYIEEKEKENNENMEIEENDEIQKNEFGTNIDIINKEPLINLMNENEIIDEINLYDKQNKFNEKYYITEIETKNITTKLRKRKKRVRRASALRQKLKDNFINLVKKYEEKEKIEDEKKEEEESEESEDEEYEEEEDENEEQENNEHNIINIKKETENIKYNKDEEKKMNEIEIDKEENNNKDIIRNKNKGKEDIEIEINENIIKEEEINDQNAKRKNIKGENVIINQKEIIEVANKEKENNKNKDI